MRQLLSSQQRNRIYSFSVIKNVLRRKQTQINNFDGNRGIQFERHLRNMILDQQNNQQIIQNQLSDQYKKIVLTSAKPVESLLKEFLDKSKSYSEEELVTTVRYLSKAFQLSKIDNQGYLDKMGFRLYGSIEWEHMIQQIKFALSDNAYISFANLTIILRELTNMGYLDMEIVKLSIKKIQKRLKIEESQKMFERYGEDWWKRLYQIDKLDYYHSSKIGYDKQLLKSQKFNNNLKILESKFGQILQKRKNLDLIPKQDFDSEEEYNNVLDLVKAFQKLINKTESFTEAVLSIRKQYAKMCLISVQDKVMRNPSLNHDLLQIEEHLIDLNLLSIEDVKNPQKILSRTQIDVNIEHEKIEEIMKILLNKYKIMDFEEFNNILAIKNNPDAAGLQEEIKSLKAQQLVQLLSSLTRYVNLQTVLYGTSDKISMLNAKWQKFFIGDEIINDKLPVQRIFKKIFAECYEFILKNEPLIQFQIFHANLATKVYWYDALMQLGICKDLFIQFVSNNITQQVIKKQLKDKQILILANLLNNLYPLIQDQELNSTNFQVSEEVHQAILQKLAAISEKTDKSQLTYKQIIGIVNYIYLYDLHRINDGQYKSLYNSYLEMLSDEVKDISEVFDNDAHIKIAHKILALQNAGNVQNPVNFHSMVSSLTDSVEMESKFCNPFLKAIKEICQKIGAKNKINFYQNFPFVITGFNYESNCPTGLYIVESDYSSLDGHNAPNGNISAYCKRIKQRINVDVEAVSINKFLDIRYFDEDNKYRPLIKLKKVDTIMSILNEYFNRGNVELKKLMDDIVEVLLRVSEKQEKLGNSKMVKAFKVKVKKIGNTLKQLMSIMNNQKKCVTAQQSRIKKYELYMTFDMVFKVDLNYFTQEQRNLIDAQFKILRSEMGEAKQLDERIKIVEDEILSTIQTNSETTKTMVQEEFKNYIGKRLSIDYLLDQKVQKKREVELQIMNRSYFLDSTYNEYEDWKARLEEVTLTGKIDISDRLKPSLGKLLALRYLPNFKRSLQILPTSNAQIQTTSLPFNWQNLYLYNDNKNNGKSEQNKEIDDLAELSRQLMQKQNALKSKGFRQKIELNQIINLQNFKHQLKVNKSMKSVCAYIMKFEFIVTILNEHLGEKSKEEPVLFAKRDPQAYFDYQSNRSSLSYLDSPYLEFIFNKIGEINNLKDLLSKRKTNKAILQTQFQIGQITKEIYFEKVKKIDMELIEIMKTTLSRKLVGQSHPSHTPILSEPSKLIQLQKDLQQIERVLQKNNYYNVQVDQDFIVSGGNLEETLKRKRSRAEVNLILYRIIYKSYSGIQLQEKQKKFFKMWAQQIQNNHKSYKPTTYTQFSTVALGNISPNDKTHLFLNYTHVMKGCGSLALNDLILELSNFFDEHFIIELEKIIIQKKYETKFPKKIIDQMFLNTRNKTLQYHSHRMQQNIMSQSAKLNEEEINQLVNMTKIFKTQGVYRRQKYNDRYDKIKEMIQIINETQNNAEFRTTFISEYLRLKDQQFYSNYDPSKIRMMKRLEKLNIWKQVFQKTKDQTTIPEIKEIVDQICKKILFLKRNPPPFFSYLILNIIMHEKTPAMCIQKLLAYIEKFKIPLEIDSDDLLHVFLRRKIKRDPLNVERKQIEKQLKELSQLNYENLGKKIFDGIL